MSRCERLFYALVILFLLALTPARSQTVGCEYPCTCVCPTPTPTPTAGGIRIGHITDLHAGATNNNATAISQAVVALKAADVVIETGDCTDGATSAQWALHNSWLAGLPHMTVAGNHDAWTVLGGAATWATSVKGYRILGINGPFCDGAWLEANWTPPVVVASHVPLSQISGSCRSAILERKPTLFLFGHLHTNTYSTANGFIEASTARGGLGNYRIIELP